MARDVFPMEHTLTIVEPIWPKLQNLLFHLKKCFLLHVIIFIIKNIFKNEGVSFEAWAKLLQLFELKID